MKRQRLAWLLAIMGALIVVRWLVPNLPAQETTSEAVVRPAMPASAAGSTEAIPAGAIQTSPPLVVSSEAKAFNNASNNDHPGNAFAARPPLVIAHAPVAPPLPVNLPVTAPAPVPVTPPPPPPPPPPAPPLSVIGTWDDGNAPGVFVSTPSGIRLAQAGVVLMLEYRVTAVTPQQLLIEHMTSKREYRFGVPRAAGK